MTVPWGLIESVIDSKTDTEQAQKETETSNHSGILED